MKAARCALVISSCVRNGEIHERIYIGRRIISGIERQKEQFYFYKNTTPNGAKS